eukprot:7108530-Lingulodinium_polyedra.AAC.1
MEATWSSRLGGYMTTSFPLICRVRNDSQFSNASWSMMGVRPRGSRFRTRASIETGWNSPPALANTAP